MFSRTDMIMWNIPHIQSECTLNVKNILQNIVSPT